MFLRKTFQDLYPYSRAVVKTTFAKSKTRTSRVQVKTGSRTGKKSNTWHYQDNHFEFDLKAKTVSKHPGFL